MIKRRVIYILPLLFVLASCGTGYQFASQRFQDGIYTRPAPPAEPVHIYSEEEIEAMAAAQITLKEYEEAKQSAFDTGFYMGLGMSMGYGWHSPWYYHPWYRGYRYWDRWYWDYHYWDPWDYWYWDPWHYGYHGYYGYYGYPGYPGHWYDPWYPGYHPVGGRPHKPQYGLSPDGGRYYGSRLDTQVGGSRVSRPGSGRSNYRRGTNSSGSYGSAGSAVISRPSSGSGSRPSAVSPSSQGSGNRNYSRVVPGSSQPSSTSTSRQSGSTTTSRQNNYNTGRSSSSSFSTGSSGSSSFGGGSYGGGSGGGSRGGGGGGSRGGGRR